MSSAPPPSSTPSPPPPSLPVTPPITTPSIAPPPLVISSPPPPPLVTPSPPPLTSPSPPPPLTSSPPPPLPPSPPATIPSSPPPPSTVTPSPPLTPSPPPPSTVTPSPPLTPSPPPPSTVTPSPPLTLSPPPPSTDTPSPPLTLSPPPPSPNTPSPPLTLSPPPPSPATPRRSPSTPTPPPNSRILSPPPPSSPSSGRGSPPTPSSVPSSFTPSQPSSSKLPTGLVVGLTLGGVAVLMLLTLIWFLRKKKRRRDDEAPPPPKAYRGNNASRPSDHMVTSSIPPSPPPRPAPVMSSSGSGSDSTYSDYPVPPLPSPGLGSYQTVFTYEELSRATNGFSESNLLGQGGFGFVFRGILRNGKDIAVKQLRAGSGQGEREFQAEVEIISRVHHRHLVSLVGYCIAGAQRLLVYEFVPNNTLEFHLHGKGRPPMQWSSRMKIAVGSAKGLSYLHENCNPKIIHRDIKAANILIDFKFEPKVADFGLAKIASDTNTHVSTRVMGTFGYLAPEYAASGKLTEKSDVFSFGVLLLELITGRRPVDTKNVDANNSLVDWARPLLNQASETGNFEVVVDAKLHNEYDREEMARMVACAAACVRHTAPRRPRMDQVARVLEGNISPSDLNQGIRPGHSNVYGSYGGSTDYDTGHDSVDLNKFRNVTREYSVSSEYSTSGVYSNTISEYDLYPHGTTSESQSTREMDTEKINRNGRGYA